MVDDNLPTSEIKQKLISSFTAITSVPREAEFFLETHQWDLDAAVSAFNEKQVAFAAAVATADENFSFPSNQPPLAARTRFSNLRIDIHVSSPSPTASDDSPSRLRLRSRSPSRADNPFAVQRAGNTRTLDISGGTDSDSDSNGEEKKSLTIVQQPEEVTRVITIWRNGFTLDDDPLTTLDDPEDANFLEIIQSLESPRKLDSDDGKIRFLIKLIKREEENFPESPKPFQGVGRTLAGSGSVSTEPQATSMDLVVDHAEPTTSIQLRLADGTRIVTRFNTHHTIRDVRGFMDATRPGGSRDYQLLIMGFPPKPLTDLDQTIEKAGISNSVVMQKY